MLISAVVLRFTLVIFTTITITIRIFSPTSICVTMPIGSNLCNSKFNRCRQSSLRHSESQSESSVRLQLEFMQFGEKVQPTSTVVCSTIRITIFCPTSTCVAKQMGLNLSNSEKSLLDVQTVLELKARSSAELIRL